MKKLADYCITGIQYTTTETGQKENMAVMLHEMLEENQLTQGKLTCVHEVINLLKSSQKIITMKWSYTSKIWVHGAYVTYRRRKPDDREVLIISAGSRPTDNLDNLIHLDCFPL